MHYQKKYNFHCHKHLEQYQYTSSNNLVSYNRFGQQEKNDEHVLKTPNFLSSDEQDSYLKNNQNQSNPFQQKIGKVLHIFLPSPIFFKKIHLVIMPIFF